MRKCPPISIFMLRALTSALPSGMCGSNSAKIDVMRWLISSRFASESSVSFVDTNARMARPGKNRA